MMPIIASYYTPGYTGEALKLITSLKAHDLEYDIREIQDQGSWNKNTQQKPHYILEVLTRHYLHGVVWIDADATIERPPTLFDTLGDLCDVAFHKRFGNELISSVVYFNQTPAVKDVLQQWIMLNDLYPNRQYGDQENLADAIDAASDAQGLRLLQLPVAYCSIFDGPDRSPTPVILQWQASRRLKHAS